MGQLADYLRAWRAEIAPYGISQPFETMDLRIIDRLEVRMPRCPVATALVRSLSHKANALRSITDIDKWLPVYEEYAEAKVGLLLLDTNLDVERIVPPTGRQSPDFRVRIGTTDFFVEVKTLHARQGVVGYRKMMDDAFETLVEIDERRDTRPIVTGETVIQPHRSPGDTNYDPWSNRQIIETLISRANGHIHSGQFNQGTTVLALELSLLPLRSSVRNELHCVYPDPHYGVATSGILWNLAFGEEGAEIFRPVEFPEASNLDGQLEAIGLIQANCHQFVSGMWILTRNETGWLVRSEHESRIAPLTSSLSALLNNERNEMLCSQHFSAFDLAEFKSMVEIKAYELWDARVRAGQTGDAMIDWLASKAALRIPTCASL
jgi:hypothetical protein